MRFPKNDLMTQFKACGRLLNEWRDTIGYAGLVVGSACWAAHTGDYKGMLFQATEAVIYREIVRGITWAGNKKPQTAGHLNRKPINHRQFGASALCVTGAVVTIDVTGILGTKFSNPGIWGLGSGLVAGLSALTVCLAISGGGAKKVIENYKTMWDWPRKKKDDGGHAQGVKKTRPSLKDGIMGRRPVFEMGPR